MFYAVIGNNYGDEGKGLAVDYLTLSGHNLVVRHNGGAQAGHTVDREDKRFVFHELSSGSFNGADTYWADTFYPDLYKLEDEINEFSLVSSSCIKIYASPLCYMAYSNHLVNWPEKLNPRWATFFAVELPFAVDVAEVAPNERQGAAPDLPRDDVIVRANLARAPAEDLLADHPAGRRVPEAYEASFVACVLHAEVQPF
jgi:hypothetical protein